MEEIFALIVSMILIVAVIPLFFWKRRRDARSREEVAEPPQVIYHCLRKWIWILVMSRFFFPSGIWLVVHVKCKGSTSWKRGTCW